MSKSVTEEKSRGTLYFFYKTVDLHLASFQVTNRGDGTSRYFDWRELAKLYWSWKS